MATFLTILSKPIWILFLVNGMCFYWGLDAAMIMEPASSKNSLTDSSNTMSVEEVLQKYYFIENETKCKEPQLDKGPNNEDNEDDNAAVDVETETATDFIYDRVPSISWRNIIDAPSKKCPPGYRKDNKGRCRLILN